MTCKLDVTVMSEFVTLISISEIVFLVALHSPSASGRGQAADCVQNLHSSRDKSGTITSPSFPKGYPANATCRYYFHGDPTERIQLSFDSINLHYPRGDATQPNDCEDVDTLTVMTTLPGGGGAIGGGGGGQGGVTSDSYNLVGTYCGSKIPPRLMSSGSKMLITFVSVIKPEATSARGFRAQYSFVTDFGIKSGEQDRNKACKFTYRSSSAKNGTFCSPNSPSLYPRNTECRYIFYGQPNERVAIQFRYIDVEGLGPMCSHLTDSDYLEFSNGGPSDSLSSATRYCTSGLERPRKGFLSDGPAYQIKFVSNTIYDGTGFEAVYSFQPGSSSVQLLRTNSYTTSFMTVSVLLSFFTTASEGHAAFII